MPKKGAKGKSKAAKTAGNIAGGQKEEIVPPTAQEVLELVTARKKLERALQAQDALKEENERLREQTLQEQTHQTEIFSYLNKELVEKSQSLHALERQVHMLENSVSNQSTDFDQKLIEEKRAARDLTTKLAKEVGRYERELVDLNNFIARKAALERELEETRTDLLSERKKHEQIIAELERKTQQEKERLRREMEAKIREAKETFMRSTDAQLETTTKSTIRDNEQMANEMAFQSVETDRLHQRNKKLAEENVSARRELALHVQGEEELAKRNHAYLSTIESLMAKLKYVESANLELEASSGAGPPLSRRDGAAGGAAAAFKQRGAILQDTLEEAYRGLETLQRDMEARNTGLERVESLRETEGARILRAAEEAKRAAGLDRQRVPPEHRSAFLDALLAALAHHGPGPGPGPD
eukprot:CAMPEP_0172172886 /NCGR_PEP_ID=MMETSP1050-20130122/12708_1 /TAXON_ID=233186 /ORGANISM="Cryptomonas curvata, Strain CCAP979/52" /LENGTH=413 /DNA_ID=CAMNT_0012844501 /DNA_START=111 /DNA_END=1349 /DNA_ORIENTATION=+